MSADEWVVIWEYDDKWVLEQWVHGDMSWRCHRGTPGRDDCHIEPTGRDFVPLAQPVEGPSFGRSRCSQSFALDSSPCSFQSAWLQQYRVAPPAPLTRLSVGQFNH
jgi:hypothetical protein